MKSSWLGVAVGVVVVLVGLAFLVRSGHQPAGRPDGQVKPSEVTKHNEHVEQRLQQLREAHALSAQGKEMSDKIEARGAMPGDNRVVSRPRAVARSMKAQPGADSPPEVPGEESETIDEDPDDIPGLKKVALHDPDPERRLAAITMLGSSDDSEAIPVLAEALSDADEEVRLAAIQGLADFTGDAPIEALEKVVSDDASADNRYEALEVLSDIGGDRARAAVEKAMTDPDEDVRGLAESILDLDENYDATPDEAQTPTPATTG